MHGTWILPLHFFRSPVGPYMFLLESERFHVLLYHVSPLLLLSSSTAASFDLCRHNSFHGVFVNTRRAVANHVNRKYSEKLSNFLASKSHLYPWVILSQTITTLENVTEGNT